MGTLVGHVIPGCFFILYGTFWCANFLWYHLKSKANLKSSSDARSRKEKHMHSASTSFFEFKRDHDFSRKSWIPFSCTRIPIEPFFKILFPALGILVETFFDYRPNSNGDNHVVLSVYRIWDSDGGMKDMGRLHHITMYTGFMLSGVVDILTLCVKLPHQTSMLFLSLAFTVEGFLFYLHTMGRDALNVEVHNLLTCVILASIIFSVLRIFAATNLVVNLGLGSSILLQGTWFIQAGFFLYGGYFEVGNSGERERGKERAVYETDEETDNHRYIMFVVACFTWHLLLVSLYNVVIWITLSALSKSRLLHRRSKTFRRRGILSKLRQGLQGQNAGYEERNKLIVEEGEVNEVTAPENGMEMRHLAETRT